MSKSKSDDERSKFMMIAEGLTSVLKSSLGTTSATSSSSSSSNNNNVSPPLASDGEDVVHSFFSSATLQNQDLWKTIVMIVGIWTIFRTLASILWQIAIGILPTLWFYLYQTCPSRESFEGRKELKRVLRGYHLSEDHPEKPKGYMESIMAKASASLMAETAFAVTGMDIIFTSYQGACLLVEMKVPSTTSKFYWIGIAGSWRYLYSRPLSNDTTTTK